MENWQRRLESISHCLGVVAIGQTRTLLAVHNRSDAGCKKGAYPGADDMPRFVLHLPNLFSGLFLYSCLNILPFDGVSHEGEITNCLVRHKLFSFYGDLLNKVSPQQPAINAELDTCNSSSAWPRRTNCRGCHLHFAIIQSEWGVSRFIHRQNKGLHLVFRDLPSQPRTQHTSRHATKQR